VGLVNGLKFRPFVLICTLPKAGYLNQLAAVTCVLNDCPLIELRPVSELNAAEGALMAGVVRLLTASELIVPVLPPMTLKLRELTPTLLYELDATAMDEATSVE